MTVSFSVTLKTWLDDTKEGLVEGSYLILDWDAPENKNGDFSKIY